MLFCSPSGSPPDSNSWTRRIFPRVPFDARSTFAGNAAAAAGRCIAAQTEALSRLQAYVATMPAPFTDSALARLAANKADRVQDSTLEMSELAARHAISPRYVRMLSEETGTTCSAYVLERRLAVAREMLLSPRCKGWSNAAIALEAGFRDVSHFIRRFEKR